jgi:hypothetical protein
MISHLVHQDFERARRKARWRALLKRLRRCNNALLSFEEIRRGLRAQVQHYGGLHQVSIHQIVGSVSRYHDFDRAFLPRRTTTRDRWEGIDRAYYEDTALPPIELYRLGETYFVKDGNHRVSVARERGQEFIDAYIIELEAPVPRRKRSPAGTTACMRRWPASFTAAARCASSRAARPPTCTCG